MKLGKIFFRLKEGQKKFGEDVATFVNTFLLTFVYFVGVGGTFIVAKIFRKNFLEIKIKKESKTYWRDLNLIKKPIKEYYKQF